MKNNIENSIKESLENLDLPYSPSSWDAMRLHLDANSVDQSGSSVEQAIKSSLEKFETAYNPSAWSILESELIRIAFRNRVKSFLATFAFIAVTIGILYVVNDSDKLNNEQSSETKLSQGIVKTNSKGNITSKEQISNTSHHKQANQTEKVVATSTNNNSTIQHSIQNIESNAIIQTNEFYDNSAETELITTLDTKRSTTSDNELNSSNNLANEINELPFIMPIVPPICEGQSLTIKNRNSYPLFIKDPNDVIYELKGTVETGINTNVSGSYQIGLLKNGAFSEKGSFVIKDAPSADFDFINTNQLYQNGLPTTEIISHSIGIDFDWIIDVRPFTGRAVAPHFFTKGKHKVTLVVANSNGCKGRIDKDITIRKDYNLMATTAFDPKSLDVRNNTFMPRALIEREDLNFMLVIVDAKDGHVMFKTSDPSHGWDGVDRSTGSELDYMDTFIWKVTIENYEVGERPAYVGSAVIVPRQR
ncbi:MAG: hypothetical protein P8H43_07080 [Crocinitomicaceae bacterium]|nr:hypothetical protein [Crocinitomicaceae bacterium]